MTDIVRRLRDWKEYDEGKINDARVEAADEITALRAENERLRAALLEIASDDPDFASGNGHERAISCARAALEKETSP